MNVPSGYQAPKPQMATQDPAQADLFNDKGEPKPFRTVMLYSWWKTPSGSRQFAIVEKVTKGQGNHIKTIKVKLLENGDSNPFHYDIDDFWALVDKGSLIEMVHNALGRSARI